MEYKVELKTVTMPNEVRLEDDPVRKGYSYDFRTTDGRQIFTIPNKAVVCIANTNKVPKTMKQLIRYSSPKATECTIFYTVWSYSKGAGREIILEAAKHIKETKGVTRFVTLSPLTQMAERFHLRNGAVLLNKGEECQNFEYENV